MKNQHTATLAGYEIPRLGMGTMALAIEGRPTNRNQAIETIHAALDAGSVTLTRRGPITCPASQEPASRRTWDMANTWFVTR